MTTAATVLGLYTANAYAGSAEIMVGTESATLDTKIAAPIAGPVSFFCRNRMTVTYPDTVSNFGVMDITYKIGNGFDVIGELQFAGAATPWLGAQYAHTFEKANLNAYGLLVLQGTWPLSVQADVVLQWTPEVTKNIDGFLQVESTHYFGARGYDFGKTLTRVGVRKDEFAFGVAADISTAENVDVNGGIFAMEQF